MIVWWSIACTSAPVDTPTPDLPTVRATADTGVLPPTAPARSYSGGWPVRPDRDAIPTGSWGTRPRVGEPFPPLVGLDAFGDEVHLYDFAGDAPVVLDLSTVWCGICQEMAAWIDGSTDEGFSPLALRDAIDAGEVRWITVLSEGASGAPATEADVRAWHAAFPHPRVPVLLDAQGQTADYVRAFGYPRLVLLDADLRLVAYDQSYTEVMAMAVP